MIPPNFFYIFPITFCQIIIAHLQFCFNFQRRTPPKDESRSNLNGKKMLGESFKIFQCYFLMTRKFIVLIFIIIIYPLVLQENVGGVMLRAAVKRLPRRPSGDAKLLQPG